MAKKLMVITARSRRLLLRDLPRSSGNCGVISKDKSSVVVRLASAAEHCGKKRCRDS